MDEAIRLGEAPNKKKLEKVSFFSKLKVVPVFPSNLDVEKIKIFNQNAFSQTVEAFLLRWRPAGLLRLLAEVLNQRALRLEAFDQMLGPRKAMKLMKLINVYPEDPLVVKMDLSQ